MPQPERMAAADRVAARSIEETARKAEQLRQRHKLLIGNMRHPRDRIDEKYASRIGHLKSDGNSGACIGITQECAQIDRFYRIAWIG